MRPWWKDLRTLAACIARLRPHFRGGRWLVISVASAALIAGALEGLAVSLLVPLLSLVLGGEGAVPMRPIQWMRQIFPGHDPSFYVIAFCLLTFGAVAAKNAVYLLSQWLAARLKRRIAVNLRGDLFERLHSAELQLFEQRTAGDFTNAFLTETHRTINAVDHLMLFGQRASIAFFYVLALLAISWQLTIAVVGIAVAMGGFITLIYRSLGRQGAELTDLNKRFSSTLLESFAGVRLIRATDSQQRESRRFAEINNALATTEEGSARATALITPIAETVAIAGGIAIIAGAYVFLVRPGVMLGSHLMGFGAILIRLLPLLNQLYGLQGYLLYLASGAIEVEKWLQSPQHPKRPFGNAAFETLKKEVRFENVTFNYSASRAALKNVSFSVPAGATVALVGPSGSGKSTIAALLLRFRTLSSGRILVDGRDVWDFSADSWHRAVAVVEQDAFLFHDTMANNIQYGYESATPEALARAVKMAHLEDVVNALPQGLNTIVGERGAMLSGGQRQRLALARALVRDPKILILDEATSALDTVSEREVQAALNEAQQGRTALVIAHRLSTIRNADWIVVLADGEVAQQGTWEQLEASPGVFASMLASANAPMEAAP
jgi:ABC-type multidrug transport system fused ATPase/permease subunit